MSRLRNALRNLPDAVFADLLESSDSYLLVVDVPGVTSDTVDVEVVDGRIAIEGRREKDVPAGFRYAREERAVFLDAELPLPPDATEDGATAALDAGVLEIGLPKAGSASHTVPIED